MERWELARYGAGGGLKRSLATTASTERGDRAEKMGGGGRREGGRKRV